MKYQKQKVSLKIPYNAHNLTLNLLNKHYFPPATLHLMMSSNGASTRRLLWKNLFIFWECSTYLSKNIGFNTHDGHQNSNFCQTNVVDILLALFL